MRGKDLDVNGHCAKTSGRKVMASNVCCPQWSLLHSQNAVSAHLCGHVILQLSPQSSRYGIIQSVHFATHLGHSQPSFSLAVQTLTNSARQQSGLALLPAQWYWLWRDCSLFCPKLFSSCSIPPADHSALVVCDSTVCTCCEGGCRAAS